MRYLSPGKFALASVVAVLMLTTYANVQTRHIQFQEIPQPDAGVSFIANFVQTQPDGSRWAGTFYQRADQSWAQYGTSSEGGRSVTMIAITNAETLYSYLFRETAGYWVRVALKSPPAKRRYRIKTPELNGLIPEDQPVAGFTVYRDQQVDGSFKLLAPDLNFFPILYQLRSGLRREVTDIQLTDPDPAVFLPPGDATVVDGKAPPVPHVER